MDEDKVQDAGPGKGKKRGNPHIACDKHRSAPGCAKRKISVRPGKNKFGSDAGIGDIRGEDAARNLLNAKLDFRISGRRCQGVVSLNPFMDKADVLSWEEVKAFRAGQLDFKGPVGEPSTLGQLRGVGRLVQKGSPGRLVFRNDAIRSGSNARKRFREDQK